MWRILIVDKIDEQGSVGECYPKELQISVLKSLSDFDKLITVVHEALHAIEFSSNIKIGHKLIGKMETPLASLIMQIKNGL